MVMKTTLFDRSNRETILTRLFNGFNDAKGHLCTETIKTRHIVVLSNELFHEKQTPGSAI